YHVLAREHVHRLAQVALLGAEVAREGVARRRHDHLVPVDRPRAVEDRHDEVDAGRQRPMILAEALDDHRLRLLHDPDAAADGDDREEGDRRDHDQTRRHRYISLSTMSVVPSTCSTETRVPGSSTVSSTEVPRQFSPSTSTRPGRPAGSIRSVTTPVLPISAS